jgi:tetratricopeptide (TPR) repeat protein
MKRYLILCALLFACRGISPANGAGCSTGKECVEKGDKIFFQGEYGKSLPYFEKAIKLDAAPGKTPERIVFKGDSEFAMEKYCLILERRQKYYEALDCYHYLSLDGTGPNIKNIYDASGIQQEEYPTHQSVVDFGKRFKKELWNIEQ